MCDFAVTQDVKTLIKTLKKKDLSIYFLGIGGVGMSALAEHFLRSGAAVSGCDRSEGDGVWRLRNMGISVAVGRGKIPASCDLVVFTLAFPPDAPEMREAVALGKTIVSRPELLGHMMLEYRCRIGVSGTHGKSSTVAMLSHIYSCLGISATVVSGADLGGGSPYIHGDNDTFIYEACEYRDAFLSFHPTVAIITGVELDHTDYFVDLESLLCSFGRVADSTTDRVIINIDDSGAAGLVRDTDKYITVGMGSGAKYTYVPSQDGTASFSLYRGGEYLGEVRSRLLGSFFATDMALAAVCAIEEGLPYGEVLGALSGYSGIKRRLQHLKDRKGVPVYYDYAHHPTEMRAVISALKAKYGRVTVVFCPHTYTRTRSLWGDFVSALRMADKSVILDVFAAREEPIAGIDAPSLSRAVGACSYYPGRADVLRLLDGLSQDVIVFMGAGNMDDLIKQVDGT